MSQEKYDVIIIGAGIGGLVCGCYLAKAGLNVLIAEQQNKAGGYCTSFTRKGYLFDVGAHTFGSLREGAMFNKVLKDLDVLKDISFVTSDIVDRIVTPDVTINLRRNIDETKTELISYFPHEKKNIEQFFCFILNSNLFEIVSKTKKIVFSEFLDSVFSDSKLKAILSIPLLNIGLPPKDASALISIILYKEFIFDGGYYPKGGTQKLPEILLEKFKSFGGKLLLSTQVKKIITSNRKIKGVVTNKEEQIFSKYVVSNSDATLTFEDLMDCKTQEYQMLKKLRVSCSAFVAYFGLNKKLDYMPKHFTTAFFSTYDVGSFYNTKDLFEKTELDSIFCIFPTLIDPGLAPEGKSIVRALVPAASDSKENWEQKGNVLCRKVIRKISQLIPDIENSIEVKEISTPDTFKKFTSNRGGAIFGWASLNDQIDFNIFPYYTSVENLFLVGHWTINGIGQSGISVVALSGYHVARKIIKMGHFKKIN